MKIDENKLVKYLETHIGENTTTYWLAKECSVSEDEEMDFETDLLIRRIAEENGFRLNDDHHAYEELGMPWVIDFFIEVADVEKDIARINKASQLKMKRLLILEEYGIYDEYKDRWVAFRFSIPWQIKKIYDEVNKEIEEYENEGILID
ncbi:MAG: hypothetical protein IKS51_00525 [Erysipelotrichaceae bacterium]|nr:hypothetical protein [Erysipelotrichaceae bacterium]